MFSISYRILAVKLLLELEVLFPSVMMKTLHRYLTQSLLLEVGNGHQQLLSHLVVLWNLIKVKLLQEEGEEVEAEVLVT